MDDLKTFEAGSMDILDPLYQKQKEDVAKMRTSLLACSDNPALAKQAINNITVLRIYHQIAKIIKYLDMMDRIEEKIYASLDYTLQNSSTSSPSTWMVLLEAQERLQKLMIDSHKLLQPYLDLKEYTIMDLAPQTDEESIPNGITLDAKSRDRLRTSAQAVLMELNAGGSDDTQ